MPPRLATFFFAFQIYCDFSGYSDIAVGSAQVMGYRLINNFDRPYFSLSISEFWKRWHISLSTWFRDYLYIPLGGNQCSPARWQFNLFLTFLISGLWHGANWTYLAWGALNGFYLLFSVWTRKIRAFIFQKLLFRINSFVLQFGRGCLTFFLICLAWIFFRSASITDAFTIFTHLHRGWATSMLTPLHLGADESSLFFSLILIGCIVGVHLLQRRGSARLILSRQRPIVRWTCYYSLLWAIVFFGVYNENQFIYFQF